MKRLKPEHVYIVVLMFFVLCAGVRYVGEYVHAAMAQPAVAAEPVPPGQ